MWASVVAGLFAFVGAALDSKGWGPRSVVAGFSLRRRKEMRAVTLPPSFPPDSSEPADRHHDDIDSVPPLPSAGRCF